MSDFSFNHIEQPAATGLTDRVIILLHGMGSSGTRAMEQSAWLAPAFPSAHLYSPDGPNPHVPMLDPKSPDMSSDPTPGRFCWYYRYSEKTRQEGLERTGELLDLYIDQCAAAHALDRSRVALIGISQGAITVFNTVPFFKESVGASIAHSGYLFSPDSLALRRGQLAEFQAAVSSKTPTCAIHGLLDATLPWQTNLEAVTTYDDAGLPIEFHLLAGVKHAEFEPRSQAIATEFIRRTIS